MAYRSCNSAYYDYWGNDSSNDCVNHAQNSFDGNHPHHQQHLSRGDSEHWMRHAPCKALQCYYFGDDKGCCCDYNAHYQGVDGGVGDVMMENGSEIFADGFRSPVE